MARTIVYMLMSHEPGRDPRIDWAATAAGTAHDVTALSLRESDAPQPNIESCGPYIIRRFPWDMSSGKAAVLRGSLRALFPSRPWRGLAWAFLGCFALAALILVVPVMVVEAIGRALRAILDACVPQRGFRAAARTVARWIGGPRRVAANFKRFYVVAVSFHQPLRSLPRPDVIHANDLDTLLAAALFKLERRCRIVYDAHEFWPHADPDMPWYGRWLLAAFERRLVRHADAVVTVSPYLAREMEKTYGLAKVDSVPNAEPWRDRSGEASALPPLPEVGGAVRFMFMGTFSPRRGLEEIIEAWAQIDQRQAVLLLRGHESRHKDDLRALAARLGLLDRSVIFLPAVAEASLVAAARQADVGVIPYKPAGLNYAYCCPNKLSQYMHAGIAVLANGLPFVKDVIEESCAGLTYDYRDPSTVRDAVRRLTDSAFRGRCAASALAYARSTFNWQTQARVLLELYAGRTGPLVSGATVAVAGEVVPAT